MEHVLFIVAVCAAVVVVVGFFIFIARRQARARKMLIREAYKELLAKHQLTTNLKDEFPHRIIGLDTVNNVFVAIQHDGDKLPSTVVPLDDVVECSIRKSGHSVASTRKNGQTVTQEFTNGIALLFQLRNGPAVEVPVYSEILDGITARPDLNATAEKWQQLVRMTIGKTA